MTESKMCREIAVMLFQCDKLTLDQAIGFLVETKSKGLIAEVRPLLDALINEAEFWVAEPCRPVF